MISSPRRLKTALIMNNPKSLTCSDVIVGASKVPGTDCQFARTMGFGASCERCRLLVAHVNPVHLPPDANRICDSVE
jgi:hypothetical protein